MFPEILNPELKVGALNPETFESGEFCRVNNPAIFFRHRTFDFAVEPKLANRVIQSQW